MCRFHIVGGECNYLLRVGRDYRLEFVPDTDWMSSCMLSWAGSDICRVLDEAQAVLRDTAKQLRLPVKVITLIHHVYCVGFSTLVSLAFVASLASLDNRKLVLLT